MLTLGMLVSLILQASLMQNESGWLSTPNARSPWFNIFYGLNDVKCKDIFPPSENVFSISVSTKTPARIGWVWFVVNNSNRVSMITITWCWVWLKLGSWWFQSGISKLITKTDVPLSCPVQQLYSQTLYLTPTDFWKF